MLNEPAVYTLYSSSRGNCIFVCDGNDCFLIDAGFSYKRLCEGLTKIGSDISDIKALFITHEHGDHTTAVGMICKKTSIPVHMIKSCGECGKFSDMKNIVFHSTRFTERVGNMTITSFPTPHDSLGSVGYVIELCGHRLGVATDIGHISNEVYASISGCDSLIIESNHDEQMLMCGSYPEELKRRILSDRGHLSNLSCRQILPRLAHDGAENILLAHLSEENNTPELAYKGSRKVLDEAGYSSVHLDVASSTVPKRLL